METAIKPESWPKRKVLIPNPKRLTWIEEQGLPATHLIRDRDTNFTAAFDRIMKTSGLRIVRFYNPHRPHQGKNNRTRKSPAHQLRLMSQQEQPPDKIECESELGGLLKHDYRKIA